MSQTYGAPEMQDSLPLQNRITELESVLRTVLEQINTHQIYNRDARALIRRALNDGVRISKEIVSPETGAAPGD